MTSAFHSSSPVTPLPPLLHLLILIPFLSIFGRHNVASFVGVWYLYMIHLSSFFIPSLPCHSPLSLKVKTEKFISISCFLSSSRNAYLPDSPHFNQGMCCPHLHWAPGQDSKPSCTPEPVVVCSLDPDSPQGHRGSVETPDGAQGTKRHLSLCLAAHITGSASWHDPELWQNIS